MTAVTTLPFGRPLTRDDLDGMPDDGHRYELVDGSIAHSTRCARLTSSSCSDRSTSS
jgi:hypothetical protein